jgi:hypothetical protein
VGKSEKFKNISHNLFSKKKQTNKQLASLGKYRIISMMTTRMKVKLSQKQ